MEQSTHIIKQPYMLMLHRCSCTTSEWNMVTVTARRYCWYQATKERCRRRFSIQHFCWTELCWSARSFVYTRCRALLKYAQFRIYALQSTAEVRAVSCIRAAEHCRSTRSFVYTRCRALQKYAQFRIYALQSTAEVLLLLGNTVMEFECRNILQNVSQVDLLIQKLMG
jgi:hypothetical protein